MPKTMGVSNLYSQKFANLVFYKNWHLQSNQKQILKASPELAHAKTSTLKRGILHHLSLNLICDVIREIRSNQWVGSNRRRWEKEGGVRILGMML